MKRFCNITIFLSLILLGLPVLAHSLDWAKANIPNRGWYIDIGGRWNDYRLSEINNYLNVYEKPRFDNGGSYKIDLWYFYSSRFSFSAGFEYIDNRRKGITYHASPLPPYQPVEYSFRLKAYIPHFEVRYFFSLPHVDYYFSLGQMFCVTKFQKRLVDQDLVGQSIYYSNREFPATGIGLAISAGMLKEITSKVKVNIQTGYRYLKSGDLEYDKGYPREVYGENIAVDFSGVFCELTVLYELIK
jgi:hypothetical protein